MPALHRMQGHNAGHHPLFNVRIYRDGYGVFSFPTQELRDRFEAAAVEVVNGPELSRDEVVVRVGRVRRGG